MIAALPDHLEAMLPGALAYRPLFLLSAVGSLLCCVLILRTPDSEATPARAGTPSRSPPRPASQRRRTAWCCA